MPARFWIVLFAASGIASPFNTPIAIILIVFGLAVGIRAELLSDPALRM
jgi:H+/Cl- antiporter ClcA